jgi:hypothetical protein
MNEQTIKIKTIRYGQPRAYADSEYEYEITVENCSEYFIKEFCTKVLNPCKQTHEQWDTKSADSYFHGYYSFTKIEANKYIYYKNSPFTD